MTTPLSSTAAPLSTAIVRRQNNTSTVITNPFSFIASFFKCWTPKRQYKFNVTIFGDSGSGKSLIWFVICHRFKIRKSYADVGSTTSENVKPVHLKGFLGKNQDLTICDVPGNSADIIKRAWACNRDGILYVFAYDSIKDFERLGDKCEAIKNFIDIMKLRAPRTSEYLLKDVPVLVVITSQKNGLQIPNLHTFIESFNNFLELIDYGYKIECRVIASSVFHRAGRFNLRNAFVDYLLPKMISNYPILKLTPENIPPPTLVESSIII